MSSYLNIYGITRKAKEKVLIFSYSRNSELYRKMQSRICYCTGSDGEEQFTDLTPDILGECILDLEDDIKRWKRMLKVQKKLPPTEEGLEQIESLKDDIRDLRFNLDVATVIKSLVDSSAWRSNGFECFKANID